MSTDFLQTKLYLPPLRPNLVPRLRLINRLNQGLGPDHKLTLVSAPAGYGKTTLIAEWLQMVEHQIAWLSLDERDNELGVFLGYVSAAIRSIFPDALPETQSILMITPLPPISAITNLLINELNQIDELFILVLDDYHLIEA